MSTKVLYSSAEVKQAIRDIFAASRGRRVAIAAFIGDQADFFLPRPEGMEVVCWPKAGGTNPNVVRKLMHRKAQVFFAASMHIKLYWTEDKGVVITSANLSTSALGAGGLKEFGVLLPSSAVNIDRVLDSIKPRPVSRAALLAPDEAHKAYRKFNPPRRPRQSAGRSFRSWYDLDRARPRWKISGYEDIPIRLAQRSAEVLMAEHGSKRYDFMLQVPAGHYQENDWILAFALGLSNARNIGWMYVHHLVKIARTDKAYDPYNPYQVIQVKPLRFYDDPPFRIDEHFRAALKASITDFGGVDAVAESDWLIPSAKICRKVYSHFSS